MNDPRDALQEARRATLARLAALTRDFNEVVAASRDTNADDEHDPEGATIAFERSQVDALVRQAQRRVVEIDAALGRLTDGRYGSCGRCGRDIAPARLQAKPEARTCIDCARRG